jgi:hypothetical protein
MHHRHMHGGKDRDLLGHRQQRCGKGKGLVAQRADIELAAKSLPARDRQDEFEAGAVDHFCHFGNLGPARLPPLRHLGDRNAAVGVEREQAEFEFVGVMKRVGAAHRDVPSGILEGILRRDLVRCKRTWSRQLSRLKARLSFCRVLKLILL